MEKSSPSSAEGQIEEEIEHDPQKAQQKAWDRLIAKNNKADDVISVNMENRPESTVEAKSAPVNPV